MGEAGPIEGLGFLDESTDGLVCDNLENFGYRTMIEEADVAFTERMPLESESEVEHVVSDD